MPLFSKATGKRWWHGVIVCCCICLVGLSQRPTSESTWSADYGEPQVGWCSYISPVLDGNLTASGERYDQTDLTAAHRRYAFGTRLRVTNLSNGRRVIVRVNDRGPYRDGRMLDVSYEAARQLGFIDEGITRVRIEVVAEN